MNIPKTTVLLAVLLLPSLVSAETQDYSYNELTRQQASIELRIGEAHQFITEGSRSASSQFYNHAFELLAQSTTRLDRADAQLEEQIDTIMEMRPTFLRSRNDDREELNGRRGELRQRYFEVNRLAQSLSRDITPHIGINIDRVRWMMGNLRYLCENATDAATKSQACRLLEEMERALNAGDLNGLKVLKGDANEFLKNSASALQAGGRDTGGPKAAEEEPPPAATPAQEEPAASQPAAPGFSVDPGNETPVTQAAQPQPRPSHLKDETVDWLKETLAILCRELQDPELRRQVCEMKDELDDAIAAGDWAKVMSLLNKTNKEVLPKVRETQPDIFVKIPNIPVEIGGVIQYFPPDFSQPGVGTRYIGGQGSRLIEETQQFIAMVGEGADARWDRRDGESRQWRFSVRVTGETQTEAGKQIGFRLEEERREGTFSGAQWQVLKDGRPVATGSGVEGTVEVKESDSYTIQFTGQTEWNSPFSIQTRLEIVL